jgi:predicted Rossmann fold nucleotide-binding protein DprA/Smf involved in DNA uptake
MDENKQAILLLSTYFSSAKKGEPTPLTPMEYGRFAFWMKQNDFQPKDLFYKFDEVLSEWVDPKNRILPERLKFLLGRGMAMGIALEKWQSAGIWTVTRSERDYPKRLKMHLKENAPALLFGVGNRQLLNAGGLSIVGSRNIDSVDQQYSKMVAQQAAREGLNIVSGGARGVDETAMLASLEAEGTAVGILANDLLKASISGKWRKYLKNNQLVMVSTYFPEASFSPGNAMGRNKYIYCLSDYCLVVRSEEGQGGTWTGAKENLKKDWIPVFVKSETDASGNPALVKLGALPLILPGNLESETGDWLRDHLNENSACTNDIFEADHRNPTDTQDKETVPESVGKLSGEIEATDEESSNFVEEQTFQEQPLTKSNEPLEKEHEQEDIFYHLFVKYITRLIGEQGHISLAELKKLNADLKQAQIVDWLERATEDGHIERKGSRHIYQVTEIDLFNSTHSGSN